jgi:Zn-dependent protease with chaperone function
VQHTTSAAPDKVTEPAPPTPAGYGRGIADRPPGYPSAAVWLRAGILRDWRGALGAFVATWFYIPLALLSAVSTAIMLGIGGLVAGGVGTEDLVPTVIRDVPLVGTLLESFLARSGGVIGGFVGFGVGLLVGALVVILLPWQQSLESPVTLVTGFAGVVAAAVAIGLLYTLYRVLFEPRLLVLTGARQMSRREAARLEPVLRECAGRLGLPNVPRLLIEDDPVLTNARTYARHIVVTTRLLDEPPEEVAALLSHELVHWRTGDEITSAFVRGIALPLVLIHAVPTWLMRTFPHSATNFIVFIFFWPVLLTMKYLVMPLHSRDIRTAEYLADQGAVIAGHVAGMRAILEKRKSFENGRSGWDSVMCASHPAHELRLDRLVDADAGPNTVAALGVDEIFTRPAGFGSRRTRIVAGSLLLAAVLLCSSLGVVQWALFRPQNAVDAYFSALADRDSARAAELLDPEVGKMVAEDDLLAEMVASTEYRPPTDVRITSLVRDDDEATAEITFSIDGSPESTGVLALHRSTSSTLGVFRGWRITSGLGALQIGAGQTDVSINGVAVPNTTEPRTLTVLPGGYTASTRPNALSQVTPETLVLPPGQFGPLDVTLLPQVAPSAKEAADQVIRKHLDGCAAQRVPQPEGCPFSIYNSSAKDVTWKIIDYPQFEIELVDPTTARVTTDYEAQGRVEVTYTASDYLGDREYTDDTSFGVDGLLTVSGDGLAYDPDQ